ncbi:MAG: HD domain-containing protein [Acidobacteriia bacterium]|nr:HD domain-containing protein [Terriglobia bacterium]
MRERFAGVDRIAVALHDDKTGLLKTFVHSTDGPTPLERYETALEGVPSLTSLAAERADRVIDDLSELAGSDHLHTAKVLEAGYRSSFTAPLFEGVQLIGFVFFDSKARAYFSGPRVEDLRTFTRLVSLAVLDSLVPARIVRSAVQVATRLTHFRDPETGAHLDRMSRYARLIIRAVAADNGLSDETVEFLFLFAPLHDIGKVAIPDAILLKRAPLSDAEFEVMKTHARRGGEIVDQVIGDLQLPNFPHAGMLRNLVVFHHEAFDGGGYPEGLSHGQIPIEARIIAVADVFDALMSQRPYKRAWTMEESLEFLVRGARTRFDPTCVNALTSQTDAVEAIRQRFVDDAGSLTESREGYAPDL